MSAEKKNRKIITKDHVASASGVLLFLFGLLVLFSGIGVGQPFRFLSFALVAGLGSVGYFAFCLFALVYGFTLTFHKRVPHVKWRITFGLFVFALGLALLLAHIGADRNESLGDFDRFGEALKAAYGEGNIPFHSLLLGGAAGFGAASLFLSVGEWLVYLVASVVLILGLLIVFFPLLLALIKRTSANAAIAKSRKGEKTKKPAKEKAKKEEDTILVEQISDDNPPLPPKQPAPQPAPQPKPAPKPAQPTVSYTRAGSVPMPTHRPSENSFPIYNEEPSFIAPSGPVNRTYESGLREALFPLGGESPAPVAPAPTPLRPQEATFFGKPIEQEQPVFQEPAPIVPEPEPEPVEAVEPLPSPSPVYVEEEPVSIETPIEVEEPSEPVAFVEPIAEEPIPVYEEPEEPYENEYNEEPEPAPVVVPPAMPTPVPPAPAKKDPYADFPDAKPLPPYQYPSHDLLKVYENTGAEAAEQEAAITKEKINRIFEDMGVGARVVNYTIGPTVTRYEVQTDPNVSYTAIEKVREDIGIRLNGVPTRFEGRVAGLSTSTLEIANANRQTVGFKEVLEGMPDDPRKKVYIPFGKSIDGKILSADLASFPHMLVAGTTGSGKSIFIHGIILSLLMRNRPEELKLVLVDPKRVEFSKYKEIPHLLCPIVKEASEAKVCLSKLVDEMEERYRLFDIAGVRDIVEYNTEFAPDYGKAIMPYIILVVDEYADLVNSCKEISESVLRIGQKARAAGICMVIATQRPDVKIITGTIKSNIPTRVALRVANQTDSVTILDRGGANDLAGYGDMLISCTQIALKDFVRAQGCYVEGKEIRSVCDFIRSQQAVCYDPKFIDLTETGASSSYGASSAPMQSFDTVLAGPNGAPLSKNDADEAKYQMIKRAVMAKDTASISSITREFGMGFPRAGRIVARLQKEGILSTASDTPNSSHGFKVLIHSDPNEPQQ